MKQRQMDGFKLIGIELRTTNDDGDSMREIPLFWEKFFKEDVLSAIPGKAEPGKIYAVYMDYDPQEPYSPFPKGFYSLILGTKVRCFEDVPEGFKEVEIPAENYVVIDVKGPVEKVVYQAWEGVWSPAFPFKRKYTSDMEIYHMDLGQGPDQHVSLCISVN